MLTMTSAEASAYARDGYIVRKQLLSTKEIAAYNARVRAPIEAAIKAGTVFAKKDRDGKTALVHPLTKAEEDQYGFLGRDERLVDLAQDAIGKPIYRCGHEFIMKEPKEGGAWEFHQDFSYFYADGLLAPQIATILVALDKGTSENGCMQVLKGSHKLGRLNHNNDRIDDPVKWAKEGQIHIIQEQFEAARKRFDFVYVEMEPGDVMLWDANLVHRTGPNHTNTRFWAYISYYNAVENGHYKEVHEYAHYEPLLKISAATILNSARRV
ncbi:ectoine hydroxylase-related dioxygenase (phytanoyl-CoA dioxygenase family) [Bradyrhizobium sp. USDA 4341]